MQLCSSLVLFIITALASCFACSQAQQPEPPFVPAQQAPAKPTPLTTPKPAAPPHTPIAPLGPPELAFPGACAPGDRFVIGGVGDVLLHRRLQRQAMRDPKRYRSLWSGVEDLFAKADIMYANLEGPVAPGIIERGFKAKEEVGFEFDGEVYTSYPRFNYHPFVVDDLKTSGVDVVSMANNHAMDRSRNGIDKTIDVLQERQMPYTGIRRARHPEESWHVEITTKGWTVAWISCTYGVNGLPDRKKQVLRCYDGREEILTLVKALRARTDIDAIILTPHWGWENHGTPLRRQTRWAHQMLDAGATAILGSHPHVLQRWERHITPEGRHTLIAYSLGNFTSNMSEVPQRSSILIYVGLTRQKDGHVVINGVRYVPLWFYRDHGQRFVADIPRQGGVTLGLEHIHATLGSYNAYDPATPLTTTPQCHRSWRPPLGAHPHNKGPGGACRAHKECGDSEDLTCDTLSPGGFCTLSCERRCRALRRGQKAHCVAQSPSGNARCVPECERNAMCRPGYRCERVKTKRGSRARICVPRKKSELE